ncbi:MAG: DinB family protein [Flammeovirgaceae bacterium]|nr:MAG: DinB family protein [Flammeovirgaceae bacterium]
MNQELDRVFSRLETARVKLEKQFSLVTEEDWQRSPGPGKWSMAQVFTHLLTSEKLSLGYMKKKAQGIEQAGTSGMWQSLTMLILIISQRRPMLKFKAPKVVMDNTPPAMNKQDLFVAWEESRLELKNFLEGINNTHARKLIYKHPVAGRLDVRQALVFFGEHIRHHRPQLMRLLHKK